MNHRKSTPAISTIMIHTSTISQTHASADVTSYFIGWICTSVQEFHAACKVFDEECQSRILVTETGHSYRLGRVGEHNVAMNIPPSGTNCRLNLVESAIDTVRTFPLIRFVFLIGIAEAAHVFNDSVRLGDVVIGTEVLPNEESGNSDRLYPSWLLSSAITNLASGPRQSIDADIYDIAVTHPEYSRPESHQNSSSLETLRWNRQHNPFRNDNGNAPQTAPRSRDQFVTIHPGKVVSVNDLSEVSEARQKIAEDEGILCIDTGSAGVLAQMDCLPIRGISLFTGNHRDGNWDCYASLAASLYAKKKLLSSINPRDVDRIKARHVSVERIQEMFSETATMVESGTRNISREGQPDHIPGLVEDTRVRLVALERMMENMPVPTEAQALDFQRTLESIKAREEDVKKTLERLNIEIDKQIARSEDDEIRTKLEKLREDVNEHSWRIGTLTESTNQALQVSSELFNLLGDKTGKTGFIDAGIYLQFATRYSNILKTLSNKLKEQSQRNPRKRASNNSAAQPASRGNTKGRISSSSWIKMPGRDKRNIDTGVSIQPLDTNGEYITSTNMKQGKTDFTDSLSVTGDGFYTNDNLPARSTNPNSVTSPTSNMMLLYGRKFKNAFRQVPGPSSIQEIRI